MISISGIKGKKILVYYSDTTKIYVLYLLIMPFNQIQDTLMRR